MINTSLNLLILDPMQRAVPCVICKEKTLYGFQVGKTTYNCCRGKGCEERVIDALTYKILFGKPLLKKDGDNWRPSIDLNHFDLVKFNINKFGWSVSFDQEDSFWVCTLTKQNLDISIYSYDDTMTMAGCKCFLILHDYINDKKKGGPFYGQDGD